MYIDDSLVSHLKAYIIKPYLIKPYIIFNIIKSYNSFDFISSKYCSTETEFRLFF